MNKIKILHIIRPAAGGMKNHLIDLVRFTDRKQYQVEVACPHGHNLREELNALGVRVLPIPLKGSISPLSDWQTVFIIARHLKKNQVDILHAHSSKGALVGRLAALIARTPVVVFTAHNSIFYEHWSPLKLKTMATVEKMLASGTQRIIAVSKALKEEIFKYEGIPESKISIVYNGVDLNKVHLDGDKLRVCKNMGIPPLGQLVGVVARLAPQKGVTYFLKAAALLKNHQVNFVVIGDGPLRQHLEQEAISLGLENRVFFTGYRSDINKIMPVLDVLVLPSVTEGLPLIILEAMAARRPVVATKVGGVPEVITHGQTGLLVEAKDSHALADAIEQLISNKDMALYIGNSARKLVEQKFTLQQMADTTMNIYQELILKKGLTPGLPQKNPIQRLLFSRLLKRKRS